jgi:hypothetical protein
LIYLKIRKYLNLQNVAEDEQDEEGEEQHKLQPIEQRLKFDERGQLRWSVVEV